jgi:hypothetical protein
MRRVLVSDQGKNRGPTRVGKSVVDVANNHRAPLVLAFVPHGPGSIALPTGRVCVLEACPCR